MNGVDYFDLSGLFLPISFIVRVHFIHIILDYSSYLNWNEWTDVEGSHARMFTWVKRVKQQSRQDEM